MKQRLLVSTVLALVATIGAANAAPITSSTVEIWNGVGPGTSTDPTQQGLPSTAEGGTNPLPLIAAQASFAAPINYNLQGTLGGSSTIAQFFAADTPSQSVPSTCTGTCPGATLSTLGFTNATLFEFEFTTGSQGGTLSVTHDDGVSLFVQGNVTNDLFPTAASAPTFSRTDMAALAANTTYDLWYSAANGDPEVLTTDFVPNTPVSTPEPASLMLLGSALVGMGWLARRRNQKA